MSKLPQILCGGLLLGVGLGLVAGGLWQLCAPAEYRASARLDVAPASSLTNSFANIEDAADVLPLEMEVLRSEKILKRVATQLDLRHVWAQTSSGQPSLTPAAVVARLRRQMDLHMALESYVIDLGFISRDPNEAARLANATATAYQQYRSEILQKQWTLGIQQQEKDRDRLKLKQSASQTAAIQLQASLHVPESQTESNAPAAFQPWAAKHEADKYTNILALLDQKIAAEKLAATQPPPIQLLITPAEPPQQPWRPDRRFGVGMTGGGLLLTMLGFWHLKRTGKSPTAPAAAPICRPAGC